MTLSDQMVEAAARALSDISDMGWQTASEYQRDAWREQARAALTAAGWAVVPEAELATLRAELAAAREALDFYACADHYPIHGAAEPDVVRNDGGRRARAALGDKP